MILIEPPRSTTAARREPLNRRELARFARLAVKAAGCSGPVSVLLTNDQRIQKLNHEFRKKNSPTDVLSFPAVAWEFEGSPKTKTAGDLAISLETAARQAEALGHSLATEVRVLILHGALHLAGYDHETDSGEMARRELRLRRQLGLTSGLIERSTTPTKTKRAIETIKKPATSGSVTSRNAAKGRA